MLIGSSSTIITRPDFVQSTDWVKHEAGLVAGIDVIVWVDVAVAVIHSIDYSGNSVRVVLTRKT